MRRPLRPLRVLALVLLALGAPAVAAAAPEGEMVWAVHISLAPVYFEPAEAPGIITPFMQEKKLTGLNVGGSAAFGNAATRIEAYVGAGGLYVYGSQPDIDGLFREQAAETDRKRREATLVKIQQLMYERAMFAPILEPAFLNGYGPRVAESGLGLINVHAYSAPYEDVRLKGK